ncbi:DUF2690 domain-containing protein [Kitasatospora misakiensis]|uniref:DUF2690 domain-containing protein n=1 Tax=Kitasatospora misakiensis TaxID=67330 RepID=A0ABW0X2P0_9ACTN
MGSAWKQLPDDLSDPARRLTEELRAVKDTTGLSLSELAARTHYSRASWERWLNGKRVITEQALDALIGAVECDGPRLRRLWNLTAAEAAASDATAPGADAEAEAEAAPEAAEAVESSGILETVEASEASEPGTVVRAEAAPAPAKPTGPTLGRSVALAAASAVAVLLLALAGVRYFSPADEDAVGPTAATLLPSASATGGTVSPAASAASAPAVPANPAPATPACQALGCAHKDPRAAGCGGDARTLLTTNIGKVVVYLRYSQKCQAAWAAITEGQPGDQATITTSAGESETALIHWGYDNYSSMVNAGNPTVSLQVCGKQAQPEGASCTSSITDLARVVANTPIPSGPASPPAATTDPSAAPTPTPAPTS